MIIFGVFLFLINKNQLEDKIFISLFALFLLIVLITPFISINYNFMRFYQQILILLSPFCIYGLFYILRFNRFNVREIVICIILILYFIFSLFLVFNIIGGTTNYLSISLNNIGEEYNKYYSHNGEVLSNTWIIENTRGIINVDAYTRTRLYLGEENPQSRIISSVLPKHINNNSYVFSGYSNKINTFNFASFKGNSISFNFPEQFLKNNKDILYNNGGSEIFR